VGRSPIGLQKRGAVCILPVALSTEALPSKTKMIGNDQRDGANLQR
jgi:hypothetical protein